MHTWQTYSGHGQPVNFWDHEAAMQEWLHAGKEVAKFKYANKNTLSGVATIDARKHVVDVLGGEYIGSVVSSIEVGMAEDYTLRLSATLVQWENVFC